MVNLSEAYRSLAMAAGRKIRCRIVIGDIVYTNEDIINFEFEDVIHIDEVNWGTACANKFTFEMKTETAFPLEEQVKPYIYFEGCEEGCPLGVFYVSRRYRKRKRYTVTCYDRMYKLGGKYTPASSITFPTTADVLYNDIRGRYGIEAADQNFVPASDPVAELPKGITVREMLGCIAGINGGCFKFNRYGQLAFKTEGMSIATITRDNYIEFSVKSEAFTVESIELLNEFIIYAAGEGTQLTTYRMENCLGTQETADRLFAEKSAFTYHAMDLKLKGLPYIEAGDVVTVQSDVSSTTYTTVVSDYIMRFDGGLSATMSTFYKQPTEEYIPEEEPAEEEPAPAGDDDNEIKYIYFINFDAPITHALAYYIGGKPIPVCSIPFTVTKPTRLLCWLNFDMNGSVVGVDSGTNINMTVYPELDGYEYMKQDFIFSRSGGYHVQHLIQLDCDTPGDHLFCCKVYNNVSIPTKGLEVMLFGQHIVGQEYDPLNMPPTRMSSWAVWERRSLATVEDGLTAYSICFGKQWIPGEVCHHPGLPFAGGEGSMMFTDGTTLTWDGATLLFIQNGQSTVVFGGGEWKVRQKNLPMGGAVLTNVNVQNRRGGPWLFCMLLGQFPEN
jgi:hypothetical protein